MDNILTFFLALLIGCGTIYGVFYVFFAVYDFFFYNEKTLIEEKKITDAKNRALNEIKEKNELIRLAKIAEQERKDKEYEEWKIANPKLGFIYVLKNDMAKGHVKIGFTNGKTSKRIKEINSGTGVIGKWLLIKHWHVDDARDCEQRIHRKFSRERTQKNREFFEIEETKAVIMLQEFMDKRGYYIDRKYWKDGECKTIYSDLDIQTLKDNFNARVSGAIKPLDLNHQVLTNQLSDHKKIYTDSYISLLFEDGIYSDIEVLDDQFASDLGIYFNKNLDEIKNTLDGNILRKEILIHWENLREGNDCNFL